MTRVLIVDDSVVVRRMLSDALTSDPRIEVVGTAANGAIALQKVSQVSPDVVILDVEMPDMNGIETVRCLRSTHARLPVIMCSSLTARGAAVTLRALAAGATDYVTKPTAAEARGDRLASFKSELIAKVLALAGPLERPQPSPSARAAAPSARPARLTQEPIRALAIGCSTGGPNALTELFRYLPTDLPVPIFIVQHMPPVFTKLLAANLMASSGCAAMEAEHAYPVEPGHVYIAPGGHHMTVARQGLRIVTLLNLDPPENSCRPAVDVLFRSLAQVYGGAVLAAVLTGMGSDGARGAKNIVDAGGAVLAQSAETCVVPSMPGAVVEAGLADKILPVDEIACELSRRVLRSVSTRPNLRLLSSRES